MRKLSSTVNDGKVDRPATTVIRPRWTRRSARTAVMSRPNNTTAPRRLSQRSATAPASTLLVEDETDVSLRAYFARLPDEFLAQYDPAWSDDQVLAWDSNFRSDGALMLVCCERDVDVQEYRRVLEARA